MIGCCAGLPTMVYVTQWPNWLLPLPGALHFPRAAERARDGLRSLVRALGYDIRRIDAHFQKRPIDFIRSRNIDVVIDVGANVGQYAARLRRDGYAG